MSSSEEANEQDQEQQQQQKDESKQQQQESSTTTTKDETKSKNSTKKAQHFDFETLFQKTLHDQQQRNAEREATFVNTNREEATDVEERLAAVSLPGRNGRDSNVDANSSNNVKVNDEAEEDDDIGPALPPGFVPDTSVQTKDFAESNKKLAEDNDDEEDVTVSSLIPATYEARIVHGHKAVLSLAFDAQGSKFVTGGQNYAVQFFDFLKMDSAMKPFRECYPAESHVINSLAFSSNGETLLVGTGEAQIRLLDRIGKQWAETVRGDQYLVDLSNTKGHTAAVNHLCWHPFNKKEFMSCSDDGSIRLWSTDDFKTITKCINTQRKVIKTRNAGGRRAIPTTCCYSRDGKLIAAGCDDGSIQIWKHGHNFANVKYLNRTAHKGSICSLEFSPDSKQILSRGMDDTLKLFDIEKFKEPLHQVENLPCMFVQSSCGYSPHGEFVFTTTSIREGKGKDTGCLLFFNSSNLELQYRIEYADAGAVACSWHPKLDQILVGLSDGTCRLYYDPRSSVRGALLCATRPVKRVRTNEVVKEEMIIAPLALDMFQPRGEEGEEKEVTEWRLRRVLRMQSGRKKPQFRKPAEMPMQGTSAGGRLAKSGGTLHSYIAQELGKTTNQAFIQDEDVRASILRHADAAEKEPLYISKAYKRTQPVPIFAEDDDEDNEPEYKLAILNTARKLSTVFAVVTNDGPRSSLVTTANDGREFAARQDPTKLRPDLLFFGENYRTCFEYIHIVDAAKFVVLFDFIILILALDFFISRVGYFDIIHCLHLIGAVGGGIGAIIGFWSERFFLFWPLIALKATKFVLCLFTAVLLLILNITYRRGLHKFIKWNYPRVEDTVSFSYLLIFLCLVFLAFDGYVFDVLYRVQLYFRRKAMAIYFMERQEILSIFV